MTRAGILIVDYFLIRRTEIDVEDLFREQGRYTYRSGWNPIAVIALVVANWQLGDAATRTSGSVIWPEASALETATCSAGDMTLR